MTQKELDQAANEYDESLTYSSVSEQYDVKKAFVTGAKWRINSVWHDAREQPQCDTFFIYENVIHAFHVDGVFPTEDEVFVWDDYVKDWGLIRWAYIEDILPIKRTDYDNR